MPVKIGLKKMLLFWFLSLLSFTLAVFNYVLVPVFFFAGIYAFYKTVRQSSEKESLSVHQLFEPLTSTFTYIVADPETLEAAIVDPVLDCVERDLGEIVRMGYTLKYTLDTHVHADHITAAEEIRRRTGAETGISAAAGVVCADLLLSDGQKLKLGGKEIQVLSTPGHTDSCLSFYTAGFVFTGDCLLISGSGRTDFQQGSAERLYESVHSKLFLLPGETIVYPAHDYNGRKSSTIANELKTNPRLGGGKSLEDFKKIMESLKLEHPKKISEALPANMACGKIKS